MAYRADERVDVYAAALRGLMQLEPDPEKQLKYLDFVEIHSHLNDDERNQYQRDYPEEVRTMQSYSARIRQEGEQIGESKVVLFQLEQKFGKIPDALRERVQQADPDTLLRWSGRILTEDSIDAVVR
jgi:hypothetical protein